MRWRISEVKYQNHLYKLELEKRSWIESFRRINCNYKCKWRNTRRWTYFVISRCIGPEFGAVVGIIFALSSAVSVALYEIAFAETVVSQLSVMSTVPSAYLELGCLKILCCAARWFNPLHAAGALRWVRFVKFPLLTCDSVSRDYDTALYRNASMVVIRVTYNRNPTSTNLHWILLEFRAQTW